MSFINDMFRKIFYTMGMFKIEKGAGATEQKEYLEYSFVDNAILLKIEKIEKNGFYEVWRQQNKEHSIQILCFNEETGEFRAFDRFHWMGEPRVVHNLPAWYKDENGNCIHCDSLESDGVYYNEDLWTPIQLHFTGKWLKEHLVNVVKE